MTVYLQCGHAHVALASADTTLRRLPELCPECRGRQSDARKQVDWLRRYERKQAR